MIKLTSELHNDFVSYSKEVSLERAFPNVLDGLKPANKACLWEMYIKGYNSSKPPVKSAKIVGGVIGSWHPHGDLAAYETLVRMSQPWINNIPEVDFHGANGSLVGGPEPAKQRYTEARTSKAVEEGMFRGLKKDLVNKVLNFSEDEEWVEHFPSLLPRLFVNGVQSIGYPFSGEWEPGNLKEFYSKVETYLSSGEVDCSDIYPDYPTGGIIINKDDIHTIYETGKGSVVLRGIATIKGNTISITALPYQTYAEPLSEEIKGLVKDGKLNGIKNVENNSDKNGIQLDVICKEDPEEVLEDLYKYTSLQKQFSVSQRALYNGELKVFTLKEYIQVYVEANLNWLKKEYQYDLQEASKRINIVNGLVQAVNNIDSVISIIKAAKSSDASIKDLIAAGYNEEQAKAIVAMRLGKLANLETAELLKEQKELDKTIKDCNKVLKSSKEQNKRFLTRFKEYVDKYGWDRRTLVTSAYIKSKATVKKTYTPKVEEVFVVLKNNTIKKIKVAEYKNDKDAVVVRTTTKSKVTLIDDHGKVLKLPVKKIGYGNNKSTGSPLNGNYPWMFGAAKEGQMMILVTADGYVKRVDAKEVLECKTSEFVLLKDLSHKVLHCSVGDKSFNATMDSGKDLKFNTKDITPRGRKSGGTKIPKVKGRCIKELIVL